MNIVVIPTYNERENIEELIASILSLPLSLDILVVDDSSPDGTWKLVEKISQKERRVKLLLRKKKEGLGKAYQEGFSLALQEGYQFIMEMDADFSHPPHFLLHLRETAENFPVVIGSRYVPGGGIQGWSLKRRLLSRMGNLYVKLFLNLPVTDTTSGFRCYRREVLEKIPLSSLSGKGFFFQIEMTYWAYRLGFPIKEIPITFVERKKGKSKITSSIIWEALFKVPKLRFQKIP